MDGEGQLKGSPGHKTWAIMSTMKLQETLLDDFINHEIVVKKLYVNVQHKGVLKVEFDFKMDEMLKKIKAAKKVAQLAYNNKDKKKSTVATPPQRKREVVMEQPETGVSEPGQVLQKTRGRVWLGRGRLSPHNQYQVGGVTNRRFNVEVCGVLALKLMMTPPPHVSRMLVDVLDLKVRVICVLLRLLASN